MVMAYDQHWAASPTAGPVAGFDWVERGIQRTLNYVPAKKVVLGLPFYTRIWYQEKESGRLSTRDFAMQRAYNLFELRNAEMTREANTGYYRAVYEYTIDGIPNIVTAWLETTGTLTEKAKLADKYELAGIAGWKKHLEADGVWDALAEVIR
jgi:spore germination protein YaaH